MNLLSLLILYLIISYLLKLVKWLISVKSNPRDEEKITAYDGYGRELRISRRDWRSKILPQNLKNNWNDAEGLFQVIVMALNDGFRKDIIPAARHLYQIDKNTQRSSGLWGIILLEENRLDEAERVLRGCLRQHGDNGIILTNLAKVQAKKGNAALSEQTLWHALEVDPNQDNGFSWYIVAAREKGGEEMYEQALHRVATLPNSWRARLWLGKLALQRQDLPAAMKFYEEALSQVSRPVPVDFLTQVGGDLGNAGYLPESLKFTVPLYQIQVHGLAVGVNLIKAYHDLGQLDKARALVNQLYSQKRHDWKSVLDFWDNEITKMNAATRESDVIEKIDMTILNFASPLWLGDHSPAHELFTAPDMESVKIAFLGSSIESPGKVNTNKLKIASVEGKLCRAIPLWLAEQVQFSFNVPTYTMIPWFGEGFIVMENRWPYEQAVQLARGLSAPADYLVLTHIKKSDQRYRVEISLLRTIDGQCLRVLTESFASKKMGQVILSMTANLKKALIAQVDLQLVTPPAFYQSFDLSRYLFHLEQFVAICCAVSVGKANTDFLQGVRGIVDDLIASNLQHPYNVTLRILLLQAVKLLQKIHPEIGCEYQEKLDLLQQKNPLPGLAQSVVQRMMPEMNA